MYIGSHFLQRKVRKINFGLKTLTWNQIRPVTQPALPTHSPWHILSMLLHCISHPKTDQLYKQRCCLLHVGCWRIRLCYLCSSVGYGVRRKNVQVLVAFTSMLVSKYIVPEAYNPEAHNCRNTGVFLGNHSKFTS